MHKFNGKEVKKRLVKWIKDYFDESGNERAIAVIGISGGKDSSIVAALCVEALGKDRVFGVLMPQGQQADISYSYDLCKFLGIKYTVINIEKAVNATYDGLYNSIRLGDLKFFTGKSRGHLIPVESLNTICTFNTPARERMKTLYAVAALIGGRVSCNSNLSESFVGFDTKWGDNAGDFAPLLQFTATEVKLIGYETSLPKKFINKTPLDGLCGKTDEESFGFTYQQLDKFIKGINPDGTFAMTVEGTSGDWEIDEKISKMFNNSRHKVIDSIPHYQFPIQKSLGQNNCKRCKMSTCFTGYCYYDGLTNERK